MAIPHPPCHPFEITGIAGVYLLRNGKLRVRRERGCGSKKGGGGLDRAMCAPASHRCRSLFRSLMTHPINARPAHPPPTSLPLSFLRQVEYLSPERVDPDAKHYGTEADSWSLGVTLLELAAGHHPLATQQAVRLVCVCVCVCACGTKTRGGGLVG